MRFALFIKNILTVVFFYLIFHSLFLDVKVKRCVVGLQQQHLTHAEASFQHCVVKYE